MCDGQLRHRFRWRSGQQSAGNWKRASWERAERSGIDSDAVAVEFFVIRRFLHFGGSTNFLFIFLFICFFLFMFIFISHFSEFCARVMSSGYRLAS